MSVQLPTALDYGSRPSLQSNRIDKPDSSGAILASAVEQAANTFTQMAVQHKTKKDRLNYSLAKQEIMTADLLRRQELKNDGEYQTHDERYSTSLRGDIESVRQKYSLDPGDGALLDAESNYIVERGRVEVGNTAYGKEMEHHRSVIDGNLITAREAILNEDSPEAAQDMMQEQIESLRAAQEKYPGMYSEEEILAKIQAFVQDVAGGTLDAMEVDAEIAEIERSIAKREADGPITPEDIAADKGSGSVADYLPRDELQKRLEAAKREKNQVDETEAAYAGSDAAYAAIGDDLGKQKEREAYVKNMYKDDAKKRDAALGVLRQRWNSERLEDDEQEKGKYRVLAEMVSEGGGDIGINELPAKLVTDLEPSYKTALDAHITRIKEHRDFADSDDWNTKEVYRELTVQERMDFDADEEIPALDENGKIMRDKEGNLVGSGIQWRDQLSRKQSDYYSDWAQAQRDSGSSTTENTSGGLTQTQIVERQLISSPWFKEKPSASSPAELKDRWARVEISVNNAVLEGMRAKNNKKLTPEELTDTINRVLLDEVYLPKKSIPGPDLWGFNPFYGDDDFRTLTPVAGLASTTPGDMSTISKLAKDAWVPIQTADAIMRPDPAQPGKDMTVRKWLENKAASLDLEPSQRDYEEALFYYLYAEKLGMNMTGSAAAELRLKKAEGF